MLNPVEAERHILSAMLYFPDCIPDVMGIVQPVHFQQENHLRIYQAIRKHHSLDMPVELTALTASLSPHDIQECVNLLNKAWTGQTAAFYARAVKSAAHAREIQRLASEIQNNPERAAELSREIIKIQEETSEPAAAPRGPLFLSTKELLSGRLKINYLVQNFLEENTTGLTFGASGSGKSFFVTDIGLHCATGNAWNGRAVKKGIVLYLCGEGLAGMPRRVWAWLLHHKKAVDDLKLFHVSRHTVDFEPRSIEEIRAEASALAESHGEEVVLFVIDTLARHLDGDENATSDMNRFIKMADVLRAGFPGSVALIIHHSGHADSGRARGSSALKGAMDFEFLVDKGRITATKMKDGEPPEPLEFKLSQVVIDREEDGTPITSAVVEYGQRAETAIISELTPNERMLKAILARHDDPVPLSDLRQAFYDVRREREPDVKANTVKNAFLRAFDGMIDKGIILEKEHMITLHDKQASRVTEAS